MTKATAAGGRLRELEEAQQNRAMNTAVCSATILQEGEQSTNEQDLKNLIIISRCNSVWLECLLWEQDAAGSSPVTSTISSIHKEFCEYSFLFISIISNTKAFITYN